MKKFLLTLFFFPLFFPLTVNAQDTPNSPNQIKTEYKRATVQSATSPERNGNTFTQNVTVKITDTDEKGTTITIENTYSADLIDIRELQTGDQIVILRSLTASGPTDYSIVDQYRLTPLLWIVVAFLIVVIIAAGKKGLGAIIGLGISLSVILLYIVPRILNGGDPLFIAISGSLFIMVVTIYLAHGIHQKTTIAVASTFLSLVITGFLAIFMVNILNLRGLGSEDAYMLQFSTISINLKGLLLGGIIIGTLGVLDDITTAQASAVYELADANRKLTTKELFKRGYKIGREHITSLVNTLVLAYAGASLPIFLFFVLNPLNQPWWLILNSEMIVEEIVRTLAGSIGLILAVPITTFLAAFFSRYRIKIN